MSLIRLGPAFASWMILTFQLVCYHRIRPNIHQRALMFKM